MYVMRDADAAASDAAGGDTSWNAPGRLPRAPSMGLLLTEPARSLADLATLPLAASWLSFAPRGDGHGVLVLPGLLASDSSTVVLRRFLRLLGYQVHGWDLGRNLGPTDEVLDGLPARLATLASLTGRPVSVIGWSLGGIYARELARQRPAQVQRVITLGSPFALTDGRQSHADRAYQRRSRLHSSDRVPTREQVSQPIGVPSTAVYSRRDGIVSWRVCIEPATGLHQNVEVRCAHLGFGVDPATLWLIADRLAVPAGERRQFRPPAPLRSLYPVRDKREE
jgi:pimeloyl-ACP methyl ester carboxylesterase